MERQRIAELAGFTAYRVYDTEARNPRTDWDHDSIMFCCHKRYELGDEQLRQSDYESWGEVLADLQLRYPGAVIHPLYLMDHSGLIMSMGPFGCPWDSGQVGFIVMPAEHGKNYPNVMDALEAEVEEYSAYLEGRAYGYEIDSPEGECVEACYGFLGRYGEDDGPESMAADARGMLRFLVQERVVEAQQTIRTLQEGAALIGAVVGIPPDVADMAAFDVEAQGGPDSQG